MKKIGIFYGSIMGATEKISEMIKREIDKSSEYVADIFNIDSCDISIFDDYEYVLLGSSTWGYGDLQDDWNTFIEMKGIPSLKDKKVAIFGPGDQEDHYDVFANAIGLLHQIASSKGAIIFGYWPIDGYKFGSETCAVKDNKFLGLALDEINQPDKSEERVVRWTSQILREFNDI